LSRCRTLAVALLTAGCSLSVLFVAPAGAARLTLGDRDLRAGMNGRDVRVLQDFLTRVGLSTPVDGAYGPFTARRVKSWERRSERRVDGRMARGEARLLRTQVNSGQRVHTSQPAPQPAAAAPVPGDKAVIDASGRAIAPESAPETVKAVIAAANRIIDKPYKYGGGHGRWEDSGYDCSGSMSYALRGGGLLDRALTSSDFARWAEPGIGQWITTYGSGGHSYMVVAGLRLDTGWNDSTSDGPSWSATMRPAGGYTARHPAGL
jgi:peptidoglycan hydrolase-like protein with peptidoglycan-binding domain